MGRNKKKSTQASSSKTKSTPNKRQKNSNLEKQSLNKPGLKKSVSSQSKNDNDVDFKTLKTSQKRRRESGDELQISAPSAKRAKKDNRIESTKNNKNTPNFRQQYQSRKTANSETSDNEINKILSLEDIESDQTTNNLTNNDRIETENTTSNLSSSSKNTQSPPSTTHTSVQDVLSKHEDESHLIDVDWENIYWEETENRNETVQKQTTNSVNETNNNNNNLEINISIKKLPNSKKHKEKHNRENENEDSNESEKSNNEQNQKKRPRPTKEEKEYACNLHKTHLLTLIAHGVSRSRSCNDEVLQGTLLSLLPSEFNKMSRKTPKEFIEFMESLCKWFLAEFTIFSTNNTVDLTKENEKTEIRIKLEPHSESTTDEIKHLIQQIEIRQLSQTDAVVIFVSLCRALKILVRLVLILQPISWKVKEQQIKSENCPSQKFPSSNTNTETLQGLSSWVEVYSDSNERWIPVDVIHCKVDSFERNVSLTYVFAFNGAVVKDVTARYTSRWSETLKKRPPKSDEWLRSTLLQFNSSVHQNISDVDDRKEDAELEKFKQSEPFPNRIDAFHNHPLYILQRHLKKYEIIHPDAKPLGYFKEQPVYSRSDVYRLHTIDKWLEEGRQVKAGEKPVKRMKRLMYRHTDQNAESDYYAEWQTEPFVPPTAVDGKVPKNKFGNVYLYKPEMLPKGCVHLRLPGLKRICRMLNIDFAPAMIGWEKGQPRPIFDGYVVCQEYEELLREAWQQDSDRREKKFREKRTEAILKRWSKLYRALLIKNRLLQEENKTDLKNPQPHKEKQKDGHKHEFPRENWRYISERDIWVKVCPCGFQVEFEQI